MALVMEVTMRCVLLTGASDASPVRWDAFRDDAGLGAEVSTTFSLTVLDAIRDSERMTDEPVNFIVYTLSGV